MAKNLTLPGNPRYQPKSLQEIFGYDNNYRYFVRVELAVMKTLGKIGVIPREDIELLTTEVECACLDITTTEVDEVERTVTKHDIRALVQVMQSRMPLALRRWVHVPLTSYDVIDTGRSLQFYDAHMRVVKPAACEVIRMLAAKAERYAGTPQIGRTHGQHALPITVGFWLASVLSRIVDNTQAAEDAAGRLIGKISGAVGAYNAQVGLNIIPGREFGTNDERPTLERLVLETLGIDAAAISTQIVPPEPLADYLFTCVMLSGSLGQFGEDCRQLMRSEIGEVRESFDERQVGSSTMAHKRNPINFENLVGMWLRTKNEFGKVLDSFISEHQRDLTGSSVSRDYPVIVVNLVQQLETLARKDKAGVPFLERITIDEEACKRNLEKNGQFVLAEPLYLALQLANYPGDAHEFVNHGLMPLAKERGLSLMQVVESTAAHDNELMAVLELMPRTTKDLLRDPANYIGWAAEKTLEVVSRARSYLTS